MFGDWEKHKGSTEFFQKNGDFFVWLSQIFGGFFIKGGYFAYPPTSELSVVIVDIGYRIKMPLL